MSDRDKILDKIKKCLALSASSNEHEAEAALRQARKMMETHGITDLDIQAAEAEERRMQGAPPYGRMAGIILSGPDLGAVFDVGADLARRDAVGGGIIKLPDHRTRF